jgi:hypothetical protein
MLTEFYLESLKRRDHLGDVGIEVRIILRWDLKKYIVELCTGFNCLRIGFSDGHFKTRKLILEFRKRLGNS